jgi:hypothetical protein
LPPRASFTCRAVPHCAQENRGIGCSIGVPLASSERFQPVGGQLAIELTANNPLAAVMQGTVHHARGQGNRAAVELALQAENQGGSRLEGDAGEEADAGRRKVTDPGPGQFALGMDGYCRRRTGRWASGGPVAGWPQEWVTWNRRSGEGSVGARRPLFPQVNKRRIQHAASVLANAMPARWKLPSRATTRTARLARNSASFPALGSRLSMIRSRMTIMPRGAAAIEERFAGPRHNAPL